MVVTEKEHIEEIVVAYQKGFDKGYDIGFLDGKEVGREEVLHNE